MAQDIHQISELLFTKLPREWSISALGAGDRWIVTSPDGSRLATVGEPLLKNPVRRAWQAMSPTYPVADRFHHLEFRAEPETPLFVLNKLHVSKRHSVVWLPGGEELGKLFFSGSKVEAERICLRVCDATGASLGEILRTRSPRYLGIMNYAIYGGSGAQLATLDSVPPGVDHWHGSYRMSVTAPLPEPLHTLLLAAALACPYMRL